MTLKQNNTCKTYFLAIILIGFFTLSPNQTVAASGAYGWFSPKVQYVGPIQGGCDPVTQASIEIRLVEKNTTNLITGNSGTWDVKVRQNKTDLTILSTTPFASGIKSSSAICFNPSVNGLQVNVLTSGSTSYHPFNGPTLFPNTDLESMKGGHFRGYVELESKSDTTPSVEAISPSGQIFAGNPTFLIGTTSMSNSFGANKIDTTRIFVRKQGETEATVFVDNTDRNTNSFFITPTMPALTEGVYYWTFHQELNGATTTKKTGSSFTFSQIPSSGAPDPISFTIDTSAPTSEVTSVGVSSISPVKLSVTNDVSDLYAGVASTTVFVKNSLDSVVFSKSLVYSPTVTVNTDIQTFEVDSGLTTGNTYRVYTVTVDKLGHSVTSAEKTITINASYAKPIISALDISNASPYEISANVNNNSSVVSAWGTCWSTVNLSANAFFTDASSKCTHSTQSKNNFFTIRHPYSSIPVSVPIYFMVYASNLAGTTTATGTETIAITATNTSPQVEFVPPSVNTASTADPGLKIISTGSTSTLNKLGICKFDNSTTRNSFTPSTSLSPAPSNCRVWNNVVNPPNWAYRNTFSLPGNNTTYYFKVFAQNANGLWAEDIGQYTTPTLSYRFSHMEFISSYASFNSPDIQYPSASPVYDAVTKAYNNLPVRIVAVDKSNDTSSTTSSTRRVVDYTLTLTTSAGIVTRTGTITTHFDGEPLNSDYVKRETFNGVPLGNVTVQVEFSNASPNVSASAIYDTQSDFVSLTDPNVLIDGIAGDESGTSSALIVDPVLKLWSTPSLIRTGQITTLNWSMNDVGADLQCEIVGPNTFATNGKYTFTANIAANLTGNVSSGPLKSSQLFKLKCLNGTEEFSTTTRVNTLGTVQEI